MTDSQAAGLGASPQDGGQPVPMEDSPDSEGWSTQMVPLLFGNHLISSPLVQGAGRRNLFNDIETFLMPVPFPTPSKQYHSNFETQSCCDSSTSDPPQLSNLTFHKHLSPSGPTASMRLCGLIYMHICVHQCKHV